MRLGRLLVIVAGGLMAVLPLRAGRTLTFEERLKAQEAIERVYDAHRIWPLENGQPKPPFEQAVSRSAVEGRVTQHVKVCDVLDRWWGRTLADQELQAEVQRMQASTKAPSVLAELLDALGHDDVVVRECLAAPPLARRLLDGLYARDARIHGPLRQAAEELHEQLSAQNFKEKAGCRYRREVFVPEDAALSDGPGTCGTIALPPDAFAQLRSALPPTGAIGPVEETDGAFLIRRTVSSSATRCEVESAVFEKMPLDEWLAEDASAGPAAALNGRLAAKTGAVESVPRAEADAWSATTTSGAPSVRYLHTALWTGAEMIIWGGYDASTGQVNTGGRYNPAIDSWVATQTTGAPTARNSHSAVWTGSQMVVWGGDEGSSFANSGGRYSPAGDAWSATSTSSAPVGRRLQSAAWSGTTMVIWGGNNAGGNLADGGRYNPTSDVWISVSATGAPAKRLNQTTVWTGTEMIVWGGNDGSTLLNTGGRYNPATDTWTATNADASAPAARWGHAAAWSGTEMLVWGGNGGTFLNSGGRYDPVHDTWVATNTTGAPSARDWHTAAWSGSEMIVWGGYTGAYENTGGRYSPTGEGWTTMTTGGAPPARYHQTAVWADTQMIVWGGSGASGDMNTGGCYMPDCSLSLPAAPAAPTFTAVTCVSQTVNWTAVAYARSYDIWRASGASCSGAVKITASPVTSTAYGDSSLSPGSPYSYYVTANNACGASPNGACATSTTGFLPGTPAAPTFSSVACTSQTVSWDAADHAATYDVWRASGASCSGAVKITSSPVASTSYGDTGLTAGATYSYFITANNACGTSSNGPCASSATVAIPASPAAPSFTAITTTTVTVNWTAVANGTTYDVWRATGTSCTGAAKITATPISGFSFTDTGRTPSAKYSYYVTANGACGTSTSGACATVTMLTGTTPGEVSPGSTPGTAMSWGANKTTLNWQSTTYATGYRLYRGVPSDLPNLLTTATDSCRRYDGTTTPLYYDLNGANDSPAAGSFLWFLVTAHNATTEGTAGYATAGARIVNSTGSCTP